MKHLLSFFSFVVLFSSFSFAQCTQCTIALPTLPTDTLYVGALADGMKNTPYEEQVSFRFSETTNPLTAFGFTAGINVNSWRITDIVGLPFGLTYVLDNPLNTPYVSIPRDGCMTICGTPLQEGVFTFYLKCMVNNSVIGDQAIDVPITINLLADTTPAFITSQIGCDSAWVNITNLQPSGNGNPNITYSWDFGNGTTSTLENPDSVFYAAAGTYVVTYESVVDTFPRIIKKVNVTSTACNDDVAPFTTNAPDLYLILQNALGSEFINNDWNIAPVVGTQPDIYPPVTIYSGNFSMDPLETYTIKVMDDDNANFDADDECGVHTLTESDFSNSDTLILSNGPSQIEIITSKFVYYVNYIDTIVVDTCASTAGLTSQANQNIELKIYPNPSEGVFQLKTDLSKVTSLQLYNIQGILVEELPISDSLDLSKFGKGTYYLTVATKEAKKSVRLIKN